MAQTSDTLSLVADIGGTNTRVALAKGPQVLKQTIRRYRNAQYPGLEAVLHQFLAQEDGPACAKACLAVAGPVRGGSATLTNLDWTIDLGTLAGATGARTLSILNDLQAQGHALGYLDPAQLRPILSGPSLSGPSAQEGAPRLVIGIGTGFNAAPVFETSAGRFVAASESGHANLPVRTEAELRLGRYVSTAHGFPAIEDVLSGRGLERVYAWLGIEAGEPREAQAADIMAACADGADPRASEAAHIFVRLLGTVCGNLSLTQLPFGGVYLAGGVARAFAPYLEQFGFGEAFRDKGRFSSFMDNFSIFVIEDDFAALTGCAAHLAAQPG